MSDKIVAPVELTGKCMELSLELRSDEIDNFKKSQQRIDSTNREQLERLPTPTVALPRDHLNCWNLASVKTDPLLDARVKSLLSEWDFHLVEIPTSFRPGGDTRIAFAVLEVGLDVRNEQTPRVYRLIPEQVAEETKEKTEYGLDPSLEVKDIAKVSLGRWIKTVEIGNLKPRVTGFWQEHSAAWELAVEAPEGVRGTKVFYLVLQQPKKAERCSLSLKARAKVETRFGMFFTRTANYSYAVTVKNVF
jgi:hypothetical protein